MVSTGLVHPGRKWMWPSSVRSRPRALVTAPGWEGVWAPLRSPPRPGGLPRATPFVVVVQSLSRVRLFVTPGTAAHQASLSFTISPSLLKLMSIESVMPSNHLILCRPLLLLPPIPPSIRVFSNESALRIRLPKYWSFSFIRAEVPLFLCKTMWE